MRIVPFSKEQHYPIMIKAWKGHGWLPCPIEALPKTGYVAEEDGKFICYAGMYNIDEGTTCMLEWAVKDPDISKELSDEGFHKIFTQLVWLAKQRGCSFVYAFTKSKAWASILESLGMVIAERGAVSYMLPLNGVDSTFMVE